MNLVWIIFHKIQKTELHFQQKWLFIVCPKSLFQHQFDQKIVQPTHQILKNQVSKDALRSPIWPSYAEIQRFFKLGLFHHPIHPKFSPMKLKIWGLACHLVTFTNMPSDRSETPMERSYGYGKYYLRLTLRWLIQHQFDQKIVQPTHQILKNQVSKDALRSPIWPSYAEIQRFFKLGLFHHPIHPKFSPMKLKIWGLACHLVTFTNMPSDRSETPMERSYGYLQNDIFQRIFKWPRYPFEGNYRG